MTVFVAMVAFLGLLICLTFAWLWRKQERDRVARQWIERERLLDRRFPTASAKDVRRRRGLRRAPRARSRSRVARSGRGRS